MSWQESNELETIDHMVTKSMTENNQNNADDIDIGSDYSYSNLGHEWWCALKWFDLTLHKDSQSLQCSERSCMATSWSGPCRVSCVRAVWWDRRRCSNSPASQTSIFQWFLELRSWDISSKYDGWARIKSVRSCCHAGLVTMRAWWDHDTTGHIQLWPPHKLLTGQAKSLINLKTRHLT